MAGALKATNFNYFDTFMANLYKKMATLFISGGLSYFDYAILKKAKML